MSIVELTFAKDHLERAAAILRKAGSVRAEDVQKQIDDLKTEIVDLQMNSVKVAA